MMAMPAIDRDAILPLIYQRVSAGLSLSKALLEVEGAPAPTTFWRWHMEDEAIRDNLARARENGAEAHLADCVDIADTATDRDSSAAAKVRIDTRIKLAQMMAPRKYKPGVDVTSGGEKISSLADAIAAGNARLHGDQA
jgi:hypothetical protein